MYKLDSHFPIHFHLNEGFQYHKYRAVPSTSLFFFFFLFVFDTPLYPYLLYITTTLSLFP